MLTDLNVSVFLATRTLQRGGTIRTFLNIIIIALVLTNMIFLPSVIGGAIDSFNQQNIDYITSDVIVKPREDKQYIDDLDTVLAKINRAPGVARASAHYAMPSSITFKEHTVAIAVTTFRPRDEIEVTTLHNEIADGEFLGSGDHDGILLGTLLAGHKDTSKDFYDSLGGVQVGDSVTVRYENGVVKDYRVKGIFNTKSYIVDYNAFITWDEMNQVLGTENNQALEILVKGETDSAPATVKQSILEYGVGEDVKTWDEALPSAVTDSVESFSIINQITVFGSLIIAIVLIFVMTTIKAFQNRKQIGILKAIGMKPQVIINSYVIQVMFICLLGTLLGLLIFGLMVLYFTAFPIEFPDGNVTPHVQIMTLLENTFLLFVSSAIAGFIPAWRITRENILDAMRGG